MEVSSSGSYHAHRGRWSGSLIQFDLLSKTVAGKQVVEECSIGFPSPGKMTVTSIEETTEGKSTLDLIGTTRSQARCTWASRRSTGPPRATEHVTAPANLLDEVKLANVDYRFTVYPGENHNSVRLASFPAALYWVYRPSASDR